MKISDLEINAYMVQSSVVIFNVMSYLAVVHVAIIVNASILNYMNYSFPVAILELRYRGGPEVPEAGDL